MRTKNELGRVLQLIEAYRSSGGSRSSFARKHRLHPSALSRILRVVELPADFLLELERLPSLSRTHLEVLATAPPERRAALLEAVRAGRSTYSIRARRESTQVSLGTAPAPVVGAVPCDRIARALGASPEETVAFAFELLQVLWDSGRDRVEGSFQAFRRSRAMPVGAGV